MNENTFSVSIKPVWKRVSFVCLLLFFLVTLLLSLFYITNDYTWLTQWYLSLNKYIYKQDEWTTNFFTPATKKNGDYLSIAAALLSLAGISRLIVKWPKATAISKYTVTIDRKKIIWHIAAATLATVAVIWNWDTTLPANDEVFSAVECTEMHPFVTLSYYMLPNNHIYFNIINKLFGWWWGDFIQSGRLISALAYIGLIQLIFYLFSNLIRNNLYAFVAIIPFALQFHIWGFAAQARGYELQLFFGWLSLISLSAYLTKQQKEGLQANTVFNIIGFLLLPSYLYFYLAQLLFMIFALPLTLKTQLSYYRHQLYLAAFVFIGYLPALYFSGIPAFTNNGWVQPLRDNIIDFWPIFTSTFNVFIIDCFSGTQDTNSIACYTAFLLPFLLLFSKQKHHRQIALFYAALWVSYILYSLKIRRTPFHRTLIIHFSITIVCCVYTYYVIITFLSGFARNLLLQRGLTITLFLSPLLAYSLHQYTFNKNSINWILYGYDTQRIHNAQVNSISQIPNGSSISFSDQSFYYLYSARKMNYKTYRYATDQSDYYIKLQKEPLPKILNGKYTLIAQSAEDYEIYKRTAH